MTKKAPPPRRKTRPTRAKNPQRRAMDKLPDFREMIDNAVEGVLIHRNFKPLYVNASFAKIFGYRSPKSLMKLPLLRPLMPADIWARVEQDYADLIRRRKEFIISRARGIRKDGREIWIAVTHRVMDWHGQPAVQITALDITRQMDVEHRLLRSEQHLRAVLEILPYPIYIVRDEDGQILFVNRKTCLLFQQSAGQLLRSKSTAFYVDPKDREDLRQLLGSVTDIRDVEVQMKTAQGREFTAEIAAIATEYGQNPAVLVALNDISQRKQLEEELYKQASTDSLTGIANRRSFMAQAEQELRRSRRFARDLSVMMLDLDHFKKVNDAHGHAIGDAVLEGFVKRAAESLRQSDTLGRLGGEEFAVILPETGIEAALDAAERLRVHLAERPLIAEREAITCTVSIGVAQLQSGDGTVDDLLHRADLALYHAKKKGRNQVAKAG